MSSTLWDVPDFKYVGYKPLTPEEERESDRKVDELINDLLSRASPKSMAGKRTPAQKRRCAKKLRVNVSSSTSPTRGDT